MQTSRLGTPLRLRAGARTDSGRGRSNNEDHIFVDVDLRLFVVADGMGGHNSGEVASRLVVESMSGFIARSHEDSDFSWPYGIESTLSHQANRLRTAINLANRRMFRAAGSHDDYTGMGSTVVSALCDTNSVILGHVGDSRAYRFRVGTPCEQLTQDDTWLVAMMAQTDVQVDATNHPMKHVLTHVLGARDQIQIHVAEHQMLEGDRLLLCSDGLHGVLSNDDLDQIISGAGIQSAQQAAECLVLEALSQGSRDNITAVVIEFGAAS